MAKACENVIFLRFIRKISEYICARARPHVTLSFIFIHVISWPELFMSA
jgi:hypothetical protein